MIPDHVRSAREPGEVAAWIVDGFGKAHAIGERSTIGRSHRNDLVVLAGSVSRQHAEIQRTAAGWVVRDLNSRNGTFVSGERCHGEVALWPRAVLRVGEVPLWFVSELLGSAPDQPLNTITTGEAGSGLVCYRMRPGKAELCIFAGDDATAGGALLSRASGADAWSERSLPPLEFQLLRALCARALAEARSPAAIRGCVATKQLARELPFQSKYANQDNVRQIVLRLRGVLAEVGAAGVLEVAPGRGYYLACKVSVAGASRPSVVPISESWS